MQISGNDQETFLYLNGIGVSRTIQLGKDIELLPANCSPMPDDIISVSKSEVDIGVISIFLGQVSSQFRIKAEDPKALAIIAWNSLWDAVLLSAIHDCEAICNFQCDRPAEEFSAKCKFEITNYHLRGLTKSVYEINDKEASWVEENFHTARTLLDEIMFQNAVHCLATYRWHSHPRARLALLWSGIEGLFNIDSELIFRLSLYVARFLKSDDSEEMKAMFLSVKRLYKQRSAAVHGSKIKGEADKAVEESAQLLKTLIKRCIVAGELPCVDELAP